jgi:uncharacterized protein YhfF
VVGVPRRGERLTETDPGALPRAEFGFVGTDLRRRLVDAVLAGDKTATAGLLADYERDGETPGRPGDRQVVLDVDDREVAVIELTEVTIRRMADVDLQFAIDEGERFASVAEWRAAHESFWHGSIDEIRAGIGDPVFGLTDDTLVVCERFRLVKRLELPG